MFYSSQSIIISHPKIIETIIFFELFLFDRNKILCYKKYTRYVHPLEPDKSIQDIYIYIYIYVHPFEPHKSIQVIYIYMHPLEP